MKNLIILLLGFSLLQASDFRGSLSSGFFMGTPFWNADNFKNGNVIDKEDSFYRSVNRLRLRGKMGRHFLFSLHTIRNDGFQNQNRLSETKIYQLYGKYLFASGYVKCGRFIPFQRWIIGSLDGAAFSLQLSKRIRISALGGRHVTYGLLYEKDHEKTLAYADAAFLLQPFSVKLKFYGDDNVKKTGIDFYGRWGKIGFNGNYGYDITDNQIADGGLSANWYVSRKLAFSGNYRLMRTLPWQWSHIRFKSYLIERFLMAARYRIGGHLYINVQQTLAMTSERKDYLSLLSIQFKYFNVGLNYLTGDSGLNRLGLLLGANYRFSDRLRLAAGVAPVDYLPANAGEHLQTVAVYLRAAYQFLNCFTVSLNGNYYHDNPALFSKFRGGIQLRYNFGS